jgi:hypothetical protein
MAGIFKPHARRYVGSDSEVKRLPDPAITKKPTNSGRREDKNEYGGVPKKK